MKSARSMSPAAGCDETARLPRAAPRPYRNTTALGGLLAAALLLPGGSLILLWLLYRRLSGSAGAQHTDGAMDSHR